jgi:hypothetical protein
MKITCQQAAIICNKTQYREASIFEILKLRLHILLCKACHKYVKRNTKLSELCKKAQLQALSDSEKESIKKRLADY